NSGGYFDGRPRPCFFACTDMNTSHSRCPPNRGMLSAIEGDGLRPRWAHGCRRHVPSNECYRSIPGGSSRA
ncbi:MAG: hypothetical protein GY750_16185, partial [Lentisphaerae bacterium]|nr:hypothetical protein [Lentisphaerota bacterium]